MKRYQQLIQTAAEETGFANLSRAIGAPTSSIHEWATFPAKVPAYKSLEKLADYFKIPIPALLMETGDRRTAEDDIIEALHHLTAKQKQAVADYIKAL